MERPILTHLMRGLLVVALLGVALGVQMTRAEDQDDEEDTIPRDAVQVEFVDVIDGDTFDVDYDLGPGKDPDRIRMIGIDTPETSYSYGN